VTTAYLIQFAVSAAAVGLMVALAAWATRGRGAAPLDEAAARAWLADEFPGRPIEGLWLADDGRGALARSGESALVLSRMGDGYVARELAWSQALAATPRNGRLALRLADAAAPRAVIAIAAWPPKGFAA
jgi:hypothetical protein